MANKTTKSGKPKAKSKTRAQRMQEAMSKPPWFVEVFQDIMVHNSAIHGETGYQLPPYVPPDKEQSADIGWPEGTSIFDTVQVPENLADEINSLAKAEHPLEAEQIAALFWLCETIIEFDKEARWPMPKPPGHLGEYSLTEVSHRDLVYAIQCITSAIEQLPQDMRRKNTAHVWLLKNMLLALRMFVHMCKPEPSRRRPPKLPKTITDEIVSLLGGDVRAANRWGIEPVAPTMSAALAERIASALLKYFKINKAPSQIKSRAAGKVPRR